MKKLMILGAGYTQIPLHKAAQRLGYKTIAASIPGNYDSFKIADEIAYTDISDPEAVLEAAVKHKADGIATCGLDLAMRAIGHTCEALKLSGPSKEAALRASNKYLMKKAFIKEGVTTAPFFCIHGKAELNNALDNLTFPVILKATDQMGSRGIYKCETRKEALEYFDLSMAATAKDYILVEKFIEGPLFGVEAMIQNGKLLFMLPNNTEIFKGATNIPVGHSVPLDNINKLESVISKEVTAGIKALGLDNCPVNCDCILQKDEVYIVEMTGRSGATGLSEIVSLKYDIDYYETIAKLAMGEDVSSDFANINENAVLTHTIASNRNGILRSITDNNPPNECIKELSFNVSAGDHVRPFTNGRDRIGQLIIRASTPEKCRSYLFETQRHIRYELEGDIPLIETPIQKLKAVFNGNNIFVKREDLLPYSHGGNKVRFADAYLSDMQAKKCSAMIIYGGYTSNLCRILSQSCKEKGIPCSMIYNTDDSDPDKKSTNAEIIRANGVKEYRCEKNGIAEAVEKAMDDFVKEGFRPYYIHGDKFGRGNTHIPMSSYEEVYYEILKAERQNDIKYDYIFLASSTNTSHSGLLAGMISSGEHRNITGISVNRKKEKADQVITANLEDYLKKYNISCDIPLADIIETDDSYLCGGYGSANDEIRALSRQMYETEGLSLDTTYTCKAFYGMKDYLKKHNITGKNILFIHTGGTVQFHDEYK